MAAVITPELIIEPHPKYDATHILSTLANHYVTNAMTLETASWLTDHDRKVIVDVNRELYAILKDFAASVPAMKDAIVEKIAHAIDEREELEIRRRAVRIFQNATTDN